MAAPKSVTTDAARPIPASIPLPDIPPVEPPPVDPVPPQ